jgi:hypothetical protein
MNFGVATAYNSLAEFLFDFSVELNSFDLLKMLSMRLCFSHSMPLQVNKLSFGRIYQKSPKIIELSSYVLFTGACATRKSFFMGAVFAC